MQVDDGLGAGYLLIERSRHSGGGSIFFFPKDTFDGTFEAPTDLKEGCFVKFKPNSPHSHRKDSFLCNHEFYHVRSIWHPFDGFEVLGTYCIDVDAFLSLRNHK